MGASCSRATATALTALNTQIAITDFSKHITQLLQFEMSAPKCCTLNVNCVENKVTNV